MIVDVTALKEYIRQNLVLSIENVDRYSSGNNMEVTLRFRGDKEPFASETIYIPETD